MKTTLACAAVAATLLGLATAAMADDAMTAKPTHMATMVCRAADTGEKPNAMSGSKALVCKPIDMQDVMSMKKTIEAMPNGEPEWLKMINEFQVGPGINNS
jgi:hypothetical protein